MAGVVGVQLNGALINQQSHTVYHPGGHKQVWSGQWS